jgi:hypothetical protein
LSDPNYAISLAVGPPFPDLKPQAPCSGLVLTNQCSSEPRRWGLGSFAYFINTWYVHHGLLDALEPWSHTWLLVESYDVILVPNLMDMHQHVGWCCPTSAAANYARGGCLGAPALFYDAWYAPKCGSSHHVRWYEPPRLNTLSVCFVQVCVQEGAPLTRRLPRF